MARVVCFGDSLTACGGKHGRFSDILADRFPDHEWINKGIGGESFLDAMARLQNDLLETHPDLALIEFGANDWWKDERPPAAWARDLETIVSTCNERGIKPMILGVFGDYLDEQERRIPKEYGTDARALEFRRMEREIAERHRCAYVPNIQERIIGDRCCWRDRNHPNEMGNRAVADALEPALERLLGSPALPVRKPSLFTTRDSWLEAVELAGDRLAAVDGERRLTFAEADREVRSIAAALWKAAGEHRPTVAVLLPNCLEYFLLYWATARVGGVVVPLNPGLKEEQTAAVLESVRPHVVILPSPRSPQAVQCRQIADSPPRVFALEAGEGCEAVADLRADAATELPDVEIGEHDLSIIMHTSGTTAAPKGCMMRHSDLRFNVAAAVNAHQFSPDDVHLLINPMFHCTALYSTLPTAAYQKSPVVITADADASHLMSCVESERVTTFLSVPTVFQRIVELPNLSQVDASSLRVIAYAGSMMPVSTIRRLSEHFPEVALHNFFGLSETISMTHVLNGENALERPDSIGKLLPFVEAIVVDEHRTPVQPGTVGELLFARENVIPGYYGQPGKLAEAIVEIDGRRWFRTGDLAEVDEDGYFYIRGRKKDMIIVGGENVFATEVEAVLLELGALREAAVVGVPATGVRASLGELVKAVLVAGDPDITKTDVLRHCHRRLASFKIPHIVEFRHALPRNPAGKVRKDQLT